MQGTPLQAAYAEADSILLQVARPFSETMSKAYAAAQTLAVDMAGIRKSGGLPRAFLSESIKCHMEEAKIFSGIWTMWEPEAYDEKDAETPQGDFATESGAVNILWIGEDGRLAAVPGDDSMFDDACYAQIRQRRAVTHPEVYYDDSMGEFISSVVALIMDGGRSLGAIGVDQTLRRAIQNRMAMVKPYETGYAMLFGPDGTVLSRPIPG